MLRRKLQQMQCRKPAEQSGTLVFADTPYYGMHSLQMARFYGARGTPARIRMGSMMTFRSLSVIALAAIVASGIAVAGITSASMQALAAPLAPIKIGIGAPITGSDAIFGAELRNGVEQAVHDINAAGGILGHKLTVDIGDDAGDPKQGIAVANKFVADHVQLCRRPFQFRRDARGLVHLCGQ